MAKKEQFESGFLNWLMNALNAFPVDRENPGTSSIKTSIRLIKSGELDGILPGGTRTSEYVPLQRGAVKIASHAKCKIVPAAYDGPNNFKELLKWKRPNVIFGEPIQINNELPKKERLDAMAEELNISMKGL